MKTKHSLVISGIVGGVIGSLLTASWVSPVTAQKDKFDTIQCRSLSVVDDAGQARILLLADDETGSILVTGRVGDTVVVLNRQIGVVGEDGASAARLSIDKLGGRISARGKEGKGRVAIGISESGHGAVSIWDKHGNLQ